MSNNHTPTAAFRPLVGYAYVPTQIAEDTNVYDAQTGLSRGTVFPTLDLPLGVYGKQFRPEDKENE